MSALLAFDTHTYVKRLVSAGMPEPQAEVIADEQRNLITNELATKRDLKELEAGLKRDIADVRRDMKEMETRLEVKLAETKADILKWVAGLMLAQAAVIAALVKLL